MLLLLQEGLPPPLPLHPTFASLSRIMLGIGAHVSRREWGGERVCDGDGVEDGQV